jgi:hypothetical protein
VLRRVFRLKRMEVIERSRKLHNEDIHNLCVPKERWNVKLCLRIIKHSTILMCGGVEVQLLMHF